MGNSFLRGWRLSRRNILMPLSFIWLLWSSMGNKEAIGQGQRRVSGAVCGESRGAASPRVDLSVHRHRRRTEHPCALSVQPRGLPDAWPGQGRGRAGSQGRPAVRSRLQRETVRRVGRFSHPVGCLHFGYVVSRQRPAHF